jgi:hypothetical protein
MFNEFYRLKAEELLNELSQVRTFVKKHNPTIGILTEEVLRKFLSTFLPKRVSVEQGFIVGEDGTLSKQVDIIIYDSQCYAPFYRINNIVVVPSSSVLAIVEVKTTVRGKKAFHELIKYFYSLSNQLSITTNKYLFIYNSADVEMLDGYFRSFDHSKSGLKRSDTEFETGDTQVYQEFDHDTFHYLPDSITGINSSYHLQKDYVTLFGRDMMGYLSYNYIDNTDKDISSLELFYRDIFAHVIRSFLAGMDQGNNLERDLKKDRNLKSVSAIELFYM